MPHTHDNAACSSTDDARRSCARALALATGCPITCRRLGFRSGCCKYVEQRKAAIYWDLALDFTLVCWTASLLLKTDRFLFSKFFQVPTWNFTSPRFSDFVIFSITLTDWWQMNMCLRYVSVAQHHQGSILLQQSINTLSAFPLMFDCEVLNLSSAHHAVFLCCFCCCLFYLTYLSTHNTNWAFLRAHTLWKRAVQ